MVVNQSGLPSAPAPAPAESAPGRTAIADWAFHVVISYDNDLDEHADSIVAGLSRGAAHGPPVTMLVDRLSTDGLRRSLLRGADAVDERVDSEDITDPAVIREFLRWSRRVAPARRVVVLFLDHGGKLDEMCLDEHRHAPLAASPEQPSASRGWLSAAAAGEVLREFSRTLAAEGSSFELLFLEQCARSTLENLYSFRATARRVLASQAIVGAPNTYYEPLIRFAARTPTAQADALAAVVSTEDAYYKNYALVDGAELSRLPERVAALADGLAGPTESHEPHDAVAARPIEPVFRYAGEDHIDLVQCLESRYRGDPAVRDQFNQWIREVLVVRLHFNLGVPPSMRMWSGVSMLAPSEAALLDQYAAMPIFRDSRWRDVVTSLLEIE